MENLSKERSHHSNWGLTIQEINFTNFLFVSKKIFSYLCQSKYGRRNYCSNPKVEIKSSSDFFSFSSLWLEKCITVPGSITIWYFFLQFYRLFFFSFYLNFCFILFPTFFSSFDHINRGTELLIYFSNRMIDDLWYWLEFLFLFLFKYIKNSLEINPHMATY